MARTLERSSRIQCVWLIWMRFGSCGSFYRVVAWKRLMRGESWWAMIGMMRYCTSGACGDGRREKAIIDLSRLVQPRHLWDDSPNTDWKNVGMGSLKNCQNVFPLDN